ncbi:MAG: beta-N-acetylhexosaminidase [Ruminococcaceae bacterium]|nr:beta-N-acetylhexosaminidase [Oscillospiraceae bacterium]
MKVHFKNAEEVQSGIALLAPDLGISLVPPSDAELTVTVRGTEENGLTVSLCKNEATIAYGGGKARFFRALAILVQWKRDGVSEKKLTETPLFNSNGAMVDMSRNAVMKPSAVEFMLRKMALMGMNTYMLYTEDTYEVEGYPYFGYMRGRYSKDELRVLDAYALALGIEMIPCIQVLGHLATALRWMKTAAYRDDEKTLLVGAEETYRLIGSMMKTLAECFTTRRVHIGMDETKSVGKGNYFDKHGYRPPHELYLEHLSRVVEIVQAHGFSPMMWSDMFFRLSGHGISGFEDYDVRTVLSDEIVEMVPKGVQQVFWDYYHPEEAFYAVNIEKHRRFGDNTVFAGGVWMWSGHCPLLSYSRRMTLPALDACRKGGIKEVLATVWHNGSESQLILSLAGLAWYADYDYHGFYDEGSMKACFARATGASYDDFERTELPNYPHGGEYCMSRALTYNDPLQGLFDRHIDGLDTRTYYTDVYKKLEGLGEGFYAPAFETVRALTDLLIDKADFGVRLKRAYDQDDREALASMVKECDLIIEKTEKLRGAHREAWMTYNKPFGWEIHDIRYGGITNRFETVKYRVQAYLGGEIDRLEELEAERLRFDGDDSSVERDHNHFLWWGYSQISNTGIL